MTIGEKIRNVRLNKKLTQKELSVLSGVSEISIRKYEAEKRFPKTENMKKIVKVFNLSLCFFCPFGDEKEIKHD